VFELVGMGWVPVGRATLAGGGGGVLLDARGVGGRVEVGMELVGVATLFRARKACLVA